MELNDKTIKKFFRYVDKILLEDNSNLLIEIYKFMSLERYTNLRKLHELYSNDSMKYSIRNQLEGYLLDHINSIEKFINIFEKEYPEFIEKQESFEKVDYWEQQLIDNKKSLGI